MRDPPGTGRPASRHLPPGGQAAGAAPRRALAGPYANGGATPVLTRRFAAAIAATAAIASPAAAIAASGGPSAIGAGPRPVGLGTLHGPSRRLQRTIKVQLPKIRAQRRA